MISTNFGSWNQFLEFIETKMEIRKDFTSHWADFGPQATASRASGPLHMTGCKATQAWPSRQGPAALVAHANLAARHERAQTAVTAHGARAVSRLPVVRGVTRRGAAAG
jgi:hypothetical protein